MNPWQVICPTVVADRIYQVGIAKRRFAIFSCASPAIDVSDSRYLEDLAASADIIILISTMPFPEAEFAKVRHLVHAHAWSDTPLPPYAVGLEVARRALLLHKCDLAFFCDNSAYPPVGGIPTLVAVFQEAKYDLMVYSDSFNNRDNICFGLAATAALTSLCPSDLTNRDTFAAYASKHGFSIEVRPCYEFPDPWLGGEENEPVLLPKAVVADPLNGNNYGLLGPLAKIRESAPWLYSLILDGKGWLQELMADEIPFTCIMATYNMAHIICRAIDAMLANTLQNFELIIVDDASSDNTEALVRQKYWRQFKTGKFRYLRLATNEGLSHARNQGLKVAVNPWILYVDADNIPRTFYIEYFAIAIKRNRNRRWFYGKLVSRHSCLTTGRAYDADILRRNNFIDSGAQCHHIDLFGSLGGFDEKLKRRVDHDLALRYSSEEEPFFIDSLILDYNDEGDSRISVIENEYTARRIIYAKCGLMESIATIILPQPGCTITRRQIVTTLAQTGEFAHTIKIIGQKPQNIPFADLDRGLLKCVEFVDPGELLVSLAESCATLIFLLECGKVWPDPYHVARIASFMAANSGVGLYGEGDISSIVVRGNLFHEFLKCHQLSELKVDLLAEFIASRDYAYHNALGKIK